MEEEEEDERKIGKISLKRARENLNGCDIQMRVDSEMHIGCETEMAQNKNDISRPDCDNDDNDTHQVEC